VASGPIQIHGFNPRFCPSALSCNGKSNPMLVVGAVTMPVCCFLSAWRKPMRHLFPIPVIAVVTGILAVLAGWWLR
jgi:hypothetical protein